MTASSSTRRNIGRGPNGEVWDLFRDLPRMLELCRAVLVERPAFVIVTAYAIRASFLAVHEALPRGVRAIFGGHLRSGELAVREEGLGPPPVDLALLPLERLVKRRFDRRAEPTVSDAARGHEPRQPDRSRTSGRFAMRKVREEAGLFVAEGLKLVADAIDGGWPIRILVHRAGEEQADARPRRSPRRGARAARFSRSRPRSSKSCPDATIRRPSSACSSSASSPCATSGWRRTACGSALDRVRDPGNLGTIIRTADAVGAEGVMLIGETTDPFGIEAVRATMGSIFNVRLAAGSAARFPRLAQGLCRRGRRHASLRQASTIASRPIARLRVLLMGNEQQGLPDDLATACDRLVKIPMAGRADSLNLAVATGVMLFEMRRARLKA